MSVITGQGVTAYPLPDEELSPTSKNAVSNEAVCEGLNEIKNTLNHKADVIYDTASGDIASFPDGADGLPVKDLTVAIEPVQAGTGDPSPTNVRPISGWTGANVTRTGFNVWNEEWEIGGIASNTGLDNNTTTNRIRSVGYTQLFTNVNYYLKASSDVYVFYYDSEKNYTGLYKNETNNYFSLKGYIAHYSKDYYYVRICPVSEYGTTYNSDISINYPSTDHDYHPGTDNVTIPISWQSSAGTVYGGTLDVTSGVLTVTDGYVDLGTLTWTRDSTSYSNTLFYADINDAKPGSYDSAPIAICSQYPVATSRVVSSGTKDKCFTIQQASLYVAKRIVIRDDSYTDAATFKTAMSGVQLVYELANPQTYQLDPVTVQTLLGQNNVWADCGPSTVEYPCDTKLYIERLTAPEEDDMIANQNIASGKYFIVNNNLYLSTTAILAGDPIKPGTNCTLTNLAAALNALNS